MTMTSRPLDETFRTLSPRLQTTVGVLLFAALIPPVLHLLSLLEGTQTGILGLLGRHPWLVVFASLALGLIGLMVTLTAGTRAENLHDVLTTARTELRSVEARMAEPREKKRDG